MYCETMSILYVYLQKYISNGGTISNVTVIKTEELSVDLRSSYLDFAAPYDATWILFYNYLFMCCVMLVCFWLSVFVLKMWMDDLFTADQIFL